MEGKGEIEQERKREYIKFIFLTVVKLLSILHINIHTYIQWNTKFV